MRDLVLKHNQSMFIARVKKRDLLAVGGMFDGIGGGGGGTDGVARK